MLVLSLDWSPVYTKAIRINNKCILHAMSKGGYSQLEELPSLTSFLSSELPAESSAQSVLVALSVSNSKFWKTKIRYNKLDVFCFF